MNGAELPVVETVSELVPSNTADVARPAPNGVSERFVRCLVRDVVGREPSPAEIAAWVGALRAGHGRRALATTALRSREYRRNEIVRLYDAFLGRAPSDEGLDFWTRALESGKQIEEIAATIVSSPEFARRRATNHDAFVRALFQDCLLRRATDAEVTCWVGLLDSHSATRLTIAVGFLASEEYQHLKLREWFRRFLRREPDREETDYWLFQLTHGQSAEKVQTDLLASQEYFYRTQYAPALTP